MGKLFKTFKLVIYIVALLYILIEGAYYFLDWSVNLGWINTVGMAMLVLSVLISFNLKRLIKKPGWALGYFVLVIIGVLGAIFKLQHWPGAAVMLTISMTLLPIYYFVWKCLYLKEYNIKGILKVCFVSMSYIGSLFILQDWPGGQIIGNLAIVVWIVFLSLQIGQLLRPKVEDAVS